MENLMKLFERFHDTYTEIESKFITAHREKHVDIDTKNIKDERFVWRNYLSDWYFQLTEEQKELLAEFQVLFGAALTEDSNDREYNLNNYDMLNNNFSIKEGIIIGNKTTKVN